MDIALIFSLIIKVARNIFAIMNKYYLIWKYINISYPVIKIILFLMSHRGTWTASFGGNGGTPFQQYSDSHTFIGVRGRSGDWIDKLSLDFNDEETGELFTSYQYGGEGGGEFLWSLPKAEITSITVWAVPTQFVHGIQFLLSNGQYSPLFGQSTGQKYDVDVSSSRIGGFAGRVGMYLDQIKFYLVPKQLS